MCIYIHICIISYFSFRFLKNSKLCLVDLVSLYDNDHNYKTLIKFSIKLAQQKNYDYLEIVGFNPKKRKIIRVTSTKAIANVFHISKIAALT